MHALIRQRSLRRALACALLLILLPVMSLGDVGVVNCKSLNLRSQASKKSKALQTLDLGTALNIVGSEGGWYKVVYGEFTGYVMKEYVNVAASSSSSGGAAKASVSNDSLASIGKQKACKPGDTGSNVKKLQRCLSVLGYYKGEIDGIYGDGTSKAVKKLQKAKKLHQDGVAGKNTIAAMFGEKVTETQTTLTTERLNWFKGGQNVIPKGAVFTVKDCKTGKTFQCRRWSGSNHMDSEPLTASDAAIMREIYHGYSWHRRAVLVKYNGHVYAASMNGMPHGTQTITNNGFEGHFCIHFYRSKTHGTKKVDSNHQSCVSTAMKYTW